MYVVTMR